MSDVQKGRVFRARYEAKHIVMALDIVEHNHNPATKIVIFRQVQPILKNVFVDIVKMEYDFKQGIDRKWLPLDMFEEDYELFTVDLETLVRAREGFYDE